MRRTGRRNHRNQLTEKDCDGSACFLNHFLRQENHLLPIRVGLKHDLVGPFLQKRLGVVFASLTRTFHPDLHNILFAPLCALMGFTVLHCLLSRYEQSRMQCASDCSATVDNFEREPSKTMVRASDVGIDGGSKNLVRLHFEVKFVW